MLMIVNVVIVFLLGSLINLEVGFLVVGLVLCGGKYILLVFLVLVFMSLFWVMVCRYVFFLCEVVC